MKIRRHQNSKAFSVRTSSGFLAVRRRVLTQLHGEGVEDPIMYCYKAANRRAITASSSNMNFEAISGTTIFVQISLGVGPVPGACWSEADCMYQSKLKPAALGEY